MSQETYSCEIPEDIKKEITFLYNIGVDVEELDYLITIKMNGKL